MENKDMPIIQKSRSQLYRERLKADPERYEKHCAAQRERDKLRRIRKRQQRNALLQGLSVEDIEINQSIRNGNSTIIESQNKESKAPHMNGDQKSLEVKNRKSKKRKEAEDNEKNKHIRNKKSAAIQNHNEKLKSSVMNGNQKSVELKNEKNKQKKVNKPKLPTNGINQASPKCNKKVIKKKEETKGIEMENSNTKIKKGKQNKNVNQSTTTPKPKASKEATCAKKRSKNKTSTTPANAINEYLEEISSPKKEMNDFNYPGSDDEKFIVQRERGRYQRKPPIYGFSEDCMNILEEFANQDAFTFDTFGKIWKENNLCLLFAGRDSEKELCEATYDMFSVVVNFLTNKQYTSMSDIRAGALYFLYFLYFKQPFPKFRVKIRITKDDWKSIQSFYGVCIASNMPQLVAALSKLLRANAFHITITPRLMGPESSDCKIMDKVADSTMSSNWNRDMKIIWDSHVLQGMKSWNDDIEKKIRDLKIVKALGSFSKSKYIENIMKFSEALAKGDTQTLKLMEDERKKQQDINIGLRRSSLKQKQIAAECVKGIKKLKQTSKMLDTLEKMSINSDNDDEDDPSSPIELSDEEYEVSDEEQRMKEVGVYYEGENSTPSRKSTRVKNNVSFANMAQKDELDVQDVDSDDSTQDEEFLPSASKSKQKRLKSEFYNPKSKFSAFKKIKKNTKKTSWKKAIILGPSYKIKAIKGKKMKHYYSSDEDQEEK